MNISFKPVPPQPVLSIAGNVLSSSASTGNQWYNSSGPISGQTGQTFTASTPGNYYSIVTLNGCSSLPSATQSFPATGVKTVTNNAIVLFPNPTRESFIIRFMHKPEGKELMLRITDVMGKSVYQQNMEAATELQVQKTEIPAGTYFVWIETAAEVLKMPLIITP